MPRHTLIRIAGIALVACALKLAPGGSAFKAFTYSLGLAHYVSAVVYAKRPIRQAWGAKTPRIMLLTTLGAALLAWRQDVSLVFIFGFHHAFNEVYVVDRWSKPERPEAAPPGAIKRLRAAGVVFNLLAFFVIMRHMPHLDFLPTDWMPLGMAACLAVFVPTLLSLRPAMKPATMLDNCGLEMISLLGVLISYFYDIPFMAVLAFHFIVWLMYPLPAIVQRGRGAAIRMLSVMAILTTAFLMFSRVGPLKHPAFMDVFFFASYVHVITAIAISDAHPPWIRHWCRARPTAASG